MLKFIAGLLIGIAVTYGTTIFADTPKAFISNTGRLNSVEVLDAKGDTVCEDPFAYKDKGIIRCE